jgi:trk system potassium uptake protein TrkA
VTEGLDESPASELEIPGEIKVIAITRGGRTELIESRSLLEAGDVVHLAVAEGAVDRVQMLLRGE